MPRNSISNAKEPAANDSEEKISSNNKGNNNKVQTEDETKEKLETEEKVNETADENEVKAPESKKDKPVQKSKSKYCSKECCKTCPSKVCPYFPRCCQLPLQNCLQLLTVADLIVAILNIGIWLYFHQYDPFAHNLAGGSNNTDVIITTTTTAKPDVMAMVDPSDFSETTTNIYDGIYLGSHYGDGDGVKSSKIGYVFRRFQQEVENECGRSYYKEYLHGYNLEITNRVFSDLLMLTYLSECIYQFIDISILATTCCFFEYTSGRLFLIIIWNMELLPILIKLYLIVESRSHRLCILQYGLHQTFRGLDALLLMHFVPMILFRAYKLLVLTYFVASILELGNLEHQTRIQGDTLHDYAEKHNEYLRMDKNRDVSDSENDDVDNM